MTEYFSESCSSRTGFFVIDTGAGQVEDDHTKNLTCPNCDLPAYKYDKSAGVIHFADSLETYSPGSLAAMPLEGKATIELTSLREALKGSLNLKIYVGNLLDVLVGEARNQIRASDSCGDTYGIAPAYSGI
jgi:hypothetical protein